MLTYRRLHARLLGNQLVESDKHGQGSVARGCGGGPSRCRGPQGMVPSGRGLHTWHRGWFVTAETWQTTRGLRATSPSPISLQGKSLQLSYEMLDEAESKRTPGPAVSLVVVTSLPKRA
jgi:hypothetical protein